MSSDRPNKIAKTGEYARQCRIVAAGLDAGERPEAIAERLGRTPRHVYRIRADFAELGWPSTPAQQLLADELGLSRPG